MKTILLSVLILFSAFHAAAQKTALSKLKIKKERTFREMELMHQPSDDYCVFTKKYSIAQRLKIYPFSSAVRVLAVSYEALSPEPDAIIRSDGRVIDPPEDTVQRGLRVTDGVLNEETLIETKTLTEQQVNELTHLLFNTNFKNRSGLNTIFSSGCFEPRNAFVFYDSKGKVFDYLEICFACSSSAAKSDKLDIGVVCTQKYKLLKAYMIRLGILHGTNVKNENSDDLIP